MLGEVISGLIEQGFGWAKTIGRMRQVMVRGLPSVARMFGLTMAAHNLMRMRFLEANPSANGIRGKKCEKFSRRQSCKAAGTGDISAAC